MLKLQIWDTPGQEEFKSVIRSYYRSCAAAFVVFDTTRKDTFRSVARWVEDVRYNSNKDVVLDPLRDHLVHVVLAPYAEWPTHPQMNRKITF